MEIRGSDGIPFIPFSTGYVILLQTVWWLCIDCASVYPLASILLFLLEKTFQGSGLAPALPLIILDGGWFVSLSPLLSTTCFTPTLKLIMPASMMTPINAIVSAPFFYLSTCVFYWFILLFRLICPRRLTGPIWLWRLSTTVEGLQTSLDNMLSLLIHMQYDLEQYLDHNPCQVCLLMGLGNEFTVQQDNGGDEDASIPTLPYQPSPISLQVPGSVGGRVEGRDASPTGSLPPSFISPPQAPVTTLEMR